MCDHENTCGYLVKVRLFIFNILNPISLICHQVPTKVMRRAMYLMDLKALKVMTNVKYPNIAKCYQYSIHQDIRSESDSASESDDQVPDDDNESGEDEVDTSTYQYRLLINKTIAYFARMAEINGKKADEPWVLDFEKERVCPCSYYGKWGYCAWIRVPKWYQKKKGVMKKNC
jgi:hypothetical protein